MKLKVFGVNYDGKTRRIVAATSQKKAAELFKTSLSCIRDYGCETHNKEEVELAIREPGVVWGKKYTQGSEWERLTPNAELRCASND